MKWRFSCSVLENGHSALTHYFLKQKTFWNWNRPKKSFHFPNFILFSNIFFFKNAKHMAFNSLKIHPISFPNRLVSGDTVWCHDVAISWKRKKIAQLSKNPSSHLSPIPNSRKVYLHQKIKFHTGKNVNREIPNSKAKFTPILDIGLYSSYKYFVNSRKLKTHKNMWLYIKIQKRSKTPYNLRTIPPFHYFKKYTHVKID